eukprot:jgi/Mesen1/158/ME1131493C07662
MRVPLSVASRRRVSWESCQASLAAGVAGFLPAYRHLTGQLHVLTTAVSFWSEKSKRMQAAPTGDGEEDGEGAGSGGAAHAREEAARERERSWRLAAELNLAVAAAHKASRHSVSRLDAFVSNTEGVLECDKCLQPIDHGSASLHRHEFEEAVRAAQEEHAHLTQETKEAKSALERAEARMRQLAEQEATEAQRRQEAFLRKQQELNGSMKCGHENLSCFSGSNVVRHGGKRGIHSLI